ncbi:hypothetical protein ScPMuIL_007536 [Solemya velum]
MESKPKRKDRFSYKIELHVHLDGAIRPQTVLELARKRGQHLETSNVEDLKADIVLTKPSSLRKLLHSFKVFMPVVAGDRDAVKRIAYEFCEDCAKENIRYVEVRYSPHFLSNTQPMSEFDIAPGDFSPRDVVETVNESLKQGQKDFDIKVNSILCCITHRPEWSLEVAQLCKEYKADGVVAIDIAGEDFEPGKDPKECLHKQAFTEAYKSGIHRTVHAGECGPSAGVKEALDHMYAERIGHGYHVLEDPELYERVLRDKIHLETCPISSIRTKACPEDIKKHPLLKFVKDACNYSINTDDPIILDNNLTDDYETALDMGLTEDQVITGIFNAARSSFASAEDKKQILSDLVRVYGPH